MENKHKRFLILVATVFALVFIVDTISPGFIKTISNVDDGSTVLIYGGTECDYPDTGCEVSDDDEDGEIISVPESTGGSQTSSGSRSRTDNEDAEYIEEPLTIPVIEITTPISPIPPNPPIIDDTEVVEDTPITVIVDDEQESGEYEVEIISSESDEDYEPECKNTNRFSLSIEDSRFEILNTIRDILNWAIFPWINILLDNISGDEESCYSEISKTLYDAKVFEIEEGDFSGCKLTVGGLGSPKTGSISPGAVLDAIGEHTCALQTIAVSMQKLAEIHGLETPISIEDEEGDLSEEYALFLASKLKKGTYGYGGINTEAAVKLHEDANQDSDREVVCKILRPTSQKKFEQMVDRIEKDIDTKDYSIAIYDSRTMSGHIVPILGSTITETLWTISSIDTWNNKWLKIPLEDNATSSDVVLSSEGVSIEYGKDETFFVPVEDVSVEIIVCSVEDKERPKPLKPR